MTAIACNALSQSLNVYVSEVPCPLLFPLHLDDIAFLGTILLSESLSSHVKAKTYEFCFEELWCDISAYTELKGYFTQK